MSGGQTTYVTPIHTYSQNKPIANSFKELAQAKYNIAITFVRCCCMLCTNNVHNQKPTLFCFYIEMWKSLWIPCCCTFLHKPPGTCKQVGDKIGPCSCPRCCLVCFGSGDNAMIREFKGTLTCYNNCATRTKVYYPCSHYKGYCC